MHIHQLPTSEKPRHPELSDADLIKRIADRCQTSMEVFYRRYETNLSLFVSGRLKDKTSVSDVVQETFLVVWKSASKFRFKSSVKTWMFRIAMNKIHDVIKNTSQLTLLEQDYDQQDENAIDPETAIVEMGDSARIRECVSKLPETFRRCIELTYFEELTCAEIAEIEGIPSGTAKSRLYYARQHLLRLLSEKPEKRRL